MANTEHRGYPLPDETKNVRQEIENLQQQVLPMLDNDIHVLFLAIAGLAPAVHGHAIGDITGLATALDGKMPASTTFSLADLTDTDGVDVAPDGYVMVKSGVLWVAQAALAALGPHGHTIGEISGLAAQITALEGLNNDRVADIAALSAGWATQPIGVPIPVFGNLAGIVEPPTNQAFRYVKMTASDAYNTGVLTGESVSGSAPLIVATAVISLAGSPINGQTINLINTERRFLRAGSSGVTQDDAFQGHRHSRLNSALNVNLGAGLLAAGSGAHGQFSDIEFVGNPITDTANGTPRTANETRGKNIGATYYMRVK